MVSNSPASREKTAVVVQAMAEQIGIRFNIELMDNARYGSTIWNKGVASYVGNYGTRPTEDAILSKLYSAAYGIDEGRWVKTEPGKKAEQLILQGRQVSDRASAGRSTAICSASGGTRALSSSRTSSTRSTRRRAT